MKVKTIENVVVGTEGFASKVEAKKGSTAHQITNEAQKHSKKVHYS